MLSYQVVAYSGGRGSKKSNQVRFVDSSARNFAALNLVELIIKSNHDRGSTRIAA